MRAIAFEPGTLVALNNGASTIVIADRPISGLTIYAGPAGEYHPAHIDRQDAQRIVSELSLWLETS